MSFEIIDFHTHPFIESQNNICGYKSVKEKMDIAYTREYFKHFGINTICGDVVNIFSDEKLCGWEKCKADNRSALELRDKHYGDFYIPGIHISPCFIDESIKELNFMKTKGVKIIGELLPNSYDWENYGEEGFTPILNEASRLGYICSFHCADDDAMDKMVKSHPDMIFVGAHPGLYQSVSRQIERAKMCDNYYLDISGTGIFCYGALRTLIDKIGLERLLFGSDYPTCNLGAFIGAVEKDPLLSDKEKEHIFSLNAKKLLRL